MTRYRIQPERCSGCGLCAKACPQQAILIENKQARILAERCTACGRSLPPDEPAAFDPAAGGTRCTLCGRLEPRARTLTPAARQTLLRLARGQPTPLRHHTTHWRLLTTFLAHHLADAGNLRSLAFLGETLEDH